MYTKKRAGWFTHIDFMVIDLLVLNIAFLIAFEIRFPGEAVLHYIAGFSMVAAYGIACVVITIACNNLNNVLRRGWLNEFCSVAVLTIGINAFGIFILYLEHMAGLFSRLAVCYASLCFFILDILARKAFRKFLLSWKIIRKKQKKKSLVIVTRRDMVQTALEDLNISMIFKYDIKGFVLEDRSPGEMLGGIPVIGTPADSCDILCRERVDEVLLFYPDPSAEMDEMISALTEMGIVIHNVIAMQRVEHFKQFVEKIGPITVLTTALNYVPPGQAFAKRCLDILGGLVGSLLTIVITIFIGPVIFISSPGHIFFTQTRIGKNGRRFKMIKFRSMYPDAEERKKDLMKQNRVKDGMMFKIDFDPRIIGNKVLPDGTRKTGIGDFIRKTSLDEFPQFFNVLIGTMSLVGTRPPTPDEWEKYRYHHRSRLAIKPGITGMWQVSGRSDITDFEEIVKLDTYYIMHQRTSLDIKIILKTIQNLFTGKGAM